MTQTKTKTKTKTKTPEKLIKSRERVRDLAEVFTAKREVDAMCDLIPTIAQAQARVLEPACGNGNFLAVILDRRLTALVSNEPAQSLPLEMGILQVFAHLYGVDISLDNVIECRARLLAQAQEFYRRNSPPDRPAPLVLWPAVSYILSHNIVHGNTLLQTPTCPADSQIVVSDWVFTNITAPLDSSATRVHRRVYKFSDLTVSPAKPIAETQAMPWTSLLAP